MEWKELTSQQKLCKVQLTPDTPLGYITELVSKTPDPFARDKPWGPWKRHETVLTWSLDRDYVLSIHAMKYMRQ